MEIICPRCKAKYQVPEGLTGKPVRCANPACQHAFNIPASTPAGLGAPLSTGAGLRPSADVADGTQSKTAVPPLPNGIAEHDLTKEPPGGQDRTTPDTPWTSTQARRIQGTEGFATGFWTGLKATFMEIKERFRQSAEAVKMGEVALNLGREVESLEAAVQSQHEKLGDTALTNRASTPDISAQLAKLAQIEDELRRKQAIVESLDETRGGESVVKEVHQELALLHSRQRAIIVEIGSSVAATRPEMPGTLGPYASLDRLQPLLVVKRDELKKKVDQVSQLRRACDISPAAIRKLMPFAGVITGTLVLLYLFSMLSSTMRSASSHLGWLCLASVLLLACLYKLGFAASSPQPPSLYPFLVYLHRLMRSETGDRSGATARAASIGAN